MGEVALIPPRQNKMEVTLSEKIHQKLLAYLVFVFCHPT